MAFPSFSSSPSMSETFILFDCRLDRERSFRGEDSSAKSVFFLSSGSYVDFCFALFSMLRLIDWCW